MTKTKKKIIVIGGGAAGIFAALSAAKHNPQAEVIVLEKTRQLLAKVRISGGGRCNVTHALFDPKKLILHYPRGGKELLGPLYTFGPKNTVAWFTARGVGLKTEEDGRMFPTTDDSGTIVSCLLNEAEKLRIEIRIEQKISSIKKRETGFVIELENEEAITCDALLLATGSSPQGHAWIRDFGHTIVPSVPSLFTLNTPSSPLLDLSGIAVTDALLTLKDSGLKQRGTLLLTHWGFSGPAPLKLSAWAARVLHDVKYQTDLLVNWIPDYTTHTAEQVLLQIKTSKPLKQLDNENPFPLPANLWKRLLQLAGVPPGTPLSHLSNKVLRSVATHLTAHLFRIEGKTTYKQEFVTCGGVLLKEVDFQTMQSKKVEGLYFAGEVLDIDGVTGGFNFQNAWTTGWIAGKSMGI